MALNSNNEPTTNFVQHRVHNSPISQAAMQPRRSWSNFNNKNFPDGKLSYETHSSSLRGGGNNNTVAMNDRTSWRANEITTGEKKFRDGKERQDVMARASQIVM